MTTDARVPVPESDAALDPRVWEAVVDAVAASRGHSAPWPSDRVAGEAAVAAYLSSVPMVPRERFEALRAELSTQIAELAAERDAARAEADRLREAALTVIETMLRSTGREAKSAREAAKGLLDSTLRLAGGDES